MADETHMVFCIPVNFAEEGTVLGGRLKSRNAAETVLFLILLLQPILALRISTKTKIYLAVLFVLPVCIFSVIGVQGESLSSFLMGVIYFLKTRKVWGKPDDGYRMEIGWKEKRKGEKVLQSSAFPSGLMKIRTDRRKKNGGGRSGFHKKAGGSSGRKRRTEKNTETASEGKQQQKE